MDKKFAEWLEQCYPDYCKDGGTTTEIVKKIIVGLEKGNCK